MLIARVWCNGFSGQLSITVPRNQNIVDGDYVRLEKVVPPLDGKKCKICSRKYKDHTLRELYEHGLMR